MTYQFWRLNEAGPDNLGLACTDDGLLLGRTPLIERRDGRSVVRERDEIERLLKRAYPGEPAVHRLMPGLATVASALNANDQCLARIAAVHLKIPDLPNQAARDALEAEDSLIKYARDQGGTIDWNPTLHPRTGTPPNPGWFAPTGGASHDSPGVRVAENDDPTRRPDASSDAVDNWVHLPPAKRIDELGDFLEWLANAKPEDEQTIRAEINRYWGSVGDIQAVATLNHMLSQVLKPGTTRQQRQQILELIDNYSRYDRPTLRNSTISSTTCWSCSEPDCLRGREQRYPAPASHPQRKRSRLLNARLLASRNYWPNSTPPHGNVAGPRGGVILNSDSAVRFMRIFRLSTRFPTELLPALNQSTSRQPRIKMPPV
jgi:hypothetical protein